MIVQQLTICFLFLTALLAFKLDNDVKINYLSYGHFLLKN